MLKQYLTMFLCINSILAALHCNPPMAVETVALATVAAITAASTYGVYNYYKENNPHPIWHNKTVQDLLNSDNFKQKTVIFDIGDVLVRLHSTKLGISKVGLGRLARYFITHRSSPSRVKMLVTELYTERDGNPMDLVNEYQGSSKELSYYHDFINRRSNERFESGRYTSKTEKDIILELASVTFDPEHFIKNVSLIADGITLLQQCAGKGHRIAILSNWDTYSFELLRKKYHDQIFKYIKPEDVFVSAKIGKLKPHTDAYQHVLDQTQNNANDCVFFDDREENCATAETLGIKAVRFIA